MQTKQGTAGSNLCASYMQQQQEDFKGEKKMKDAWSALHLPGFSLVNVTFSKGEKKGPEQWECGRQG